MSKQIFGTVEVLESRQRHTTVAEVGATVTNGTLTIVGTQAADNFSIEAARGSFTTHLNSIAKTYSTSAVRFIRIYGGDGNDSIILSPRLAIRASIEGGNGNDRIGGGSLNDTILGQRGNDTLAGNAGNDYLDAGADNDYIEDYQGYNVAHGGSGSDSALLGIFPLGTGVERAQLYNGAKYNIGPYTTLRQANGRTYLRYAGDLGSISDSSAFTDVLDRADGKKEAVTTLKEYGGGAIPGGFDHEWDVTDALTSGLVFTQKSNEFPDGSGYPEFSVPFFMPVK